MYSVKSSNGNITAQVAVFHYNFVRNSVGWSYVGSLSRRSPRAEVSALSVRKLVGHDPVSVESETMQIAISPCPVHDPPDEGGQAKGASQPVPQSGLPKTKVFSLLRPPSVLADLTLISPR